MMQNLPENNEREKVMIAVKIFDLDIKTKNVPTFPIPFPINFPVYDHVMN